MVSTRRRPLYDEFAWVYDLIIEGPVQKRCSFFQEAVSRRGLPHGARVLDAGCGTGSYTIELARTGYAVTGLDASPALVAVAREKSERAGLPVTFQVGDVLNLPLTREYDAVLCRGVLNDIVDETRRQEVFFSFARALRPSGILVLDVREWHATARRKRQQPVFEKTVEIGRGALTFRSVTQLVPETQRMLITERHVLEKSGKQAVTEHEFTMRCWTEAELCESLTRAGFGHIRLFGAYDRRKPLGASDRMIAVASLTAKGGDAADNRH